MKEKFFWWQTLKLWQQFKSTLCIWLHMDCSSRSKQHVKSKLLGVKVIISPHSLIPLLNTCNMWSGCCTVTFSADPVSFLVWKTKHKCGISCMTERPLIKTSAAKNCTSFVGHLRHYTVHHSPRSWLLCFKASNSLHKEFLKHQWRK